MENKTNAAVDLAFVCAARTVIVVHIKYPMSSCGPAMALKTHVKLWARDGIISPMSTLD